MIRCCNCKFLYKIKLRNLLLETKIGCPECRFEIDIAKLKLMRVIGALYTGVLFLLLYFSAYMMSNVLIFSFTMSMILLFPIVLFLGLIIYRELIYLTLSKILK